MDDRRVDELERLRSFGLVSDSDYDRIYPLLKSGSSAIGYAMLSSSYGKRLSSLGEVAMYENGLSFSGPEEMCPGFRAWREISGVSITDGTSATSDVTIPRALVLGVMSLAVPKRTDGTRFLMVEGDGFCWASEFDSAHASDAVRFAASCRSRIR